MILDGRKMATELYGDAGQDMDPQAYLMSFGYLSPLIGAIAQVALVPAEVNHGVWIWQCDCGAPGMPAPGGVVFHDQPVGWCPRCQNVDCGGLWRPLVVPTDRKRRMIERRLLVRPELENRNWLPSETTRDLDRENAEHLSEVA